MDLAGIEPASESLSLEASPITATPFTFPHPAGEQRPSGFSSFIIRLQTQSFACIVSRNNDAGYRTYGCARADGCDYAATANSLSAFNFKNPVLSWSGPRMASSTSKPPSKPVQALVNKSLNSLLLNHKTQVRSINRTYNFHHTFAINRPAPSISSRSASRVSLLICITYTSQSSAFLIRASPSSSQQTWGLSGPLKLDISQ